MRVNLIEALNIFLNVEKLSQRETIFGCWLKSLCCCDWKSSRIVRTSHSDSSGTCDKSKIQYL